MSYILNEYQHNTSHFHSRIISAQVQQPTVVWLITPDVLYTLCSGVTLIVTLTRHSFAAGYKEQLIETFRHLLGGVSQ